MKRSSFAPRLYGREPRPALVIVPPEERVQRAVMGGSLNSAPIPKTAPFRCKPLLEAVRQVACTWDDCDIKDGTVCAAHSNFHEFGGKAGARKADDSMIAAMCCRHHSMLDQGKDLDYEAKKAMWLRAHNRTKDRMILLALDDRRLRELLARAGWVK